MPAMSLRNHHLHHTQQQQQQRETSAGADAKLERSGHSSGSGGNDEEEGGETGITSGRKSNDIAQERKLKVTLEDKNLWHQFNELTNEMIVTKSGR